MVWIFLSVALVLAVIHPGFRKVIYWLLGLVAGAFVLMAIRT